MSKDPIMFLKLSGFIIVCWIMSQAGLAKNIGSNEFLLLDTNKGERKSLNHLLYHQKKKVIRQKLGTPFTDKCMLCPEVHLRLSVRYSPLEILLWFCLSSPCHVTCCNTQMHFYHPTAYGYLLWISPLLPSLNE